MQLKNGVYVDDEPPPQRASLAPALLFPVAAMVLAWWAVGLVARAPSTAAIGVGAILPLCVGLVPIASSVVDASHSVTRRAFLLLVGIVSSALGGVFYFALVAVAARGLGENMP